MRFGFAIALALVTEGALCAGPHSKTVVAETVVFGLLFSVLVDWLMISIAFRKSGAVSLVEHLVLGLFFSIGGLAVEVIALLTEDVTVEGNLVLAARASFVILCLVQMAFGFLVRKEILLSSFSRLHIVRKLHRFTAFAFVVLGKTIMGYCVYRSLSGDTREFFPVLATAYGLTLLVIHLFAFAHFRRRLREPVELKTSGKRELFEEIVAMIERDDLFEPDSTVLADSRSAADDQRLSKLARTQWVVVEDRLYDLSELYHPGGNFVFKAIDKRDITRLLLQDQHLIVFDKRNGKFRSVRHRHDFRLELALRAHCVGQIRRRPPFGAGFREGHFGSLADPDNESVNLFKKGTKEPSRPDGEETAGGPEFQFKALFPVGGKFAVGLVGLADSSELGLDLRTYWLKLLGNYYIVCSGDRRLFCYSVLCLNPKYLQLRQRFLQLCSPTLADLAEFLQSGVTQRIAETKDQSAEFVSEFYPVLVSKAAGEMESARLEFHGPMGFGLGFRHSATDRFLLLACDEGIVPFLDFFEVVLNRRLIAKYRKSTAGHVFSEEYALVLANGLTFTVVWTIRPDFRETAKTLGLPHLHLLETLRRDSPEGHSIVGEVTITDSPDLKSHFGLFHYAPDLRADLRARKPEDFDRVLVSGDNRFRRGLLRLGFLDRFSSSSVVVL